MQSPAQLMNAVLLIGYGGLDKLEYRQVPIPEPKSDEVLIKVGACSINNTDINTRTGWYGASEDFQSILQDKSVNPGRSAGWNQTGLRFPRIQGIIHKLLDTNWSISRNNLISVMLIKPRPPNKQKPKIILQIIPEVYIDDGASADIAGKVVSVGPNGDSELMNQRVLVDDWVRVDDSGDPYRSLGSELDGGFANYVVVPSKSVYPIKSDLSDVELSTFPCAYSTAENMLTRARVVKTDTVLITGASGGVGSAAIQLAKLRGATVIALAGAKKLHLVAELGADVCYAREDENLSEKLANHNVTAVMDVVGGALFSIVIKSLSVGGRYATAGAIAGPMVEFDLRDLIYKDLEMFGATRAPPDVFFQVVSYIEQGRLKPLVDKTFKLFQIREAQEYFQEKSYFGKVVLVP